MLLSERNYISFQLSIVLFYFCSIERNPSKDCSCVCVFFLYSHSISENPPQNFAWKKKHERIIGKDLCSTKVS